MSLSEAASRCDVVSVRVNAVAILGITGSTLAKEKGSAPTLEVCFTLPVKVRIFFHLYLVILYQWRSGKLSFSTSFSLLLLCELHRRRMGGTMQFSIYG